MPSLDIHIAAGRPIAVAVGWLVTKIERIRAVFIVATDDLVAMFHYGLAKLSVAVRAGKVISWSRRP